MGERVGRYLGILGRDQVDFSQVPAIMLLESEDIELFRKIECICESLEAKRFQQENLLAMDMQHVNPGAMMQNLNNNVNLNACGYGSRLLRVTAMMLEKAVVWPVTHVVAKALETQAAHGPEMRALVYCMIIRGKSPLRFQHPTQFSTMSMTRHSFPVKFCTKAPKKICSY